MKSTKKYMPSLGFVILLVVVISSTLFIGWAISPLSYEKALILEKKGHKFAKEGETTKASEYFLDSAKIKDDNISTSRRYRCAGSTASSENDKIKYFKLSLKYNPNNKNAKESLAKFFQEIRYKNRYVDGWSKGKNAQSIINSLDNKTNYTLTYFTNNSKKVEHNIKISIDGKTVKKETIQKSQKYKFYFILNEGKHIVEILINETFNPLKLGMSKDSRDLGIHFDIKRREN